MIASYYFRYFWRIQLRRVHYVNELLSAPQIVRAWIVSLSLAALLVSGQTSFRRWFQCGGAYFLSAMGQLTDTTEIVDVVESQRFEETFNDARARARDTVQYHRLAAINRVSKVRDGFYRQIDRISQRTLPEFILGADIDQLAAIVNELTKLFAPNLMCHIRTSCGQVKNIRIL
jgi:hypothetical protein